MKILGVGGGGCNALDRMVLDGVNPSHLVALHTDAQVLTACVAGEKIELGQSITRGFGTGGDPELGRQAAEESGHTIRRLLEGNEVVFLVGGLGGGTGSGAMPLIAQWAREAGALVIAVVTLPFAFEGNRRQTQAREALEALGACADAVICFENDRMSESVPPAAPVSQAFTVTDHTLSQAVQAIAALFFRKGYIHIGFDELKALLGGRGSSVRTLFGYGEATGDNRALEALKKALKHPLLHHGLRECGTVLIQVSGGPDLLLDEVQLLMEEFHRQMDAETRIFFGAAVDNQLSGRVTVTLFGSVGLSEAVSPAEPVTVSALSGPADAAELEAEEELVRFDHPVAAAPEPTVLEAAEDAGEKLIRFETPVTDIPSEPEAEEESTAGEEEEEEQPSLFTSDNQPYTRRVVVEEEEEPKEEPRPVAPAGTRLQNVVRRPVVEKPAPQAAPAAPAAAKVPHQETLKFETVNRGRFEKSEPTIIDGQDLDIPTYLRRNIRLRI